MPKYTKKYTHHLKPNKRTAERMRNGSMTNGYMIKWFALEVVGKILPYPKPLRKAFCALQVYGLRDNFVLNMHIGGKNARGTGKTPREAYRNAWRASRLARSRLEDVLKDRARLERKVKRLLAERAELLKKLQDVEQNSDAADLREGLQRVRLALAGTTLAAGQPLDARVRAVVERMFELDRLYTAEKRRVEELKRGQQHQVEVIRSLLELVRKSAGEGSPTYARALSMARAVHVTAPAKSEVPA